MFGPNVVLREEKKDDGSELPGETEADMAKMVNAAVSSQLKRLLPKAIGDAIGGLKLDEQIASAIGKLTPKIEDEGTPSKKKSDVEKQLEALTVKLEAAEKRVEAEQKQRVEAEQKRTVDAATSTLRNSLQPKLRSEILDIAVGHWTKVEGRLSIAEDGTPQLRVKHAPYKGADEVEENLPLDKAIPILLASDSAKPFLPAPASTSGGPQVKGGIGNRASSSSAQSGLRANADDDKLSRAMQRLQEAGIDPSNLLGV